MYAQQVDTLNVYNLDCDSENPYELDTTYFWYASDTLFIRKVENKFAGSQALKASVTTTDDSIKIQVYDVSEVWLAVDCSFGYTIKIETGAFDSLVVQIFDEAFTVKYADIQTGVDKVYTDANLFYPNPVRNQLHLSIDQVDEVRIIDLSGKTVLNQFGNTKSVDISGLHKGIYLISIRAEDKVYTRKMIKQ